YKDRLAPAEHMVFFHFLVAGRCKVRLNDTGEMLDACAGDLVLFPQDDRHLMGSDLQVVPLGEEGGGNPDVKNDPEFIQLRHGGGGATTRFVCGYLLCSRSMCRPLFEALPRMLRIPIGDGQA